MGLLDGKVAIVTGAGGGLGRSHALQLAREGALLVINDLGGARDGVGTSSAAAEMVAEEIRAAGGKAVADFNNVATQEGAAGIAKSALDAFGRIDILVNNAGILRDKTFVKMTRDQWDAVIAVHLTGTMLVTRACLPALMESGSGSIINTTSIAGLKGNYGQSNYAAAKAGIWSFTNVIAMELGRSGVRANCIAPIAKTRMTEDIDIVADDQKPEYVSPMVVFLASDLAAEVTGRTFGCHGAEIIEYKMLLTPGAQRDDGHWTAQEISRRLPEIEALSVGAAPAPAAAPAAAAPVTPAQVTDEVFSRMGEAFLPEKGAGWTANLLFDIKGIGEYSVAISGGSVTTAKGKVGEPTCVINFASGDTFIDIVMGKEKAEKAFMAGKIKASNMADLMRYATSFDMTKGAKEIAGRLTAAAAPAAAPAAAAAAAPSASSVTDEVFSRMAEAFLPEKGAGWTANLLFDIKGIGEYSVAISGGSVTTAKGKVGEPTCVINFASGDTFIDIVMGKEKAEKAFMAGKIKASNMADLMRYATSFDMTKGAKEIAARIAAPAAAPVAPRSPVGLRYREPAEFARAADIEAYAKATRDSNPRYAEGTEQIAPPLFAVRAVHKMAQGAVMDRSLDLDLGRLVHGEQEMTFHQVLRPWDLMTPRGQLLKVEEKASGKVIDLGQTIFVDGAPAVEIVSRYFIRGSKSGGSSEPAAEPERGAPLFTSTATLEPGQTVDYAAASRDDNPIHTDDSIAKAVGFPSVIGHGLLTMAFVQRGVIDNLLAGEAANLKRLKVRFSKPVLPGDEITTRGWLKSEANGRRIIEIESVNQRGEKVITNGEAELA